MAEGVGVGRRGAYHHLPLCCMTVAVAAAAANNVV